MSVDTNTNKPTKPTKSSKKTTKNPANMEELLRVEKYKIPTYSLGEVIEGTISSILPKEVLVNIGGKANAVVGHKEQIGRASCRERV